ncbi:MULTISPECIES: ArsR/SmtB family transcription factor [unclassified Streptomyces]|uniref:ArsR/SmtB family transcription factor n=1 Tax=unclassified Streptomyces TaxID=2593676 RepID=UPI00244285F1|nr:helix-turn-helix domain-containing protein [Streptomyces sp. DH41]MDG9722904.1 helix-turn-helix domain-containing protein [Streptomyces sp. DH41]
MLRIGFGADDLNRLRVAAGSDFMWEVVLSLQLLQNRHAALVFDPWRRQVREGLARAGLNRMTRALMEVSPFASYFPDFLTPGPGTPDPDTGLDAVLSTPRRRLRRELARLYPDRPMPPGARRLAEGGSEALHRLGTAVRAYHAVAVAPYKTIIDRAVGADLAKRADSALAAGAEGLLSSYQPELLSWRDGRLECGYPFDRGLELNGRPLTLIPSFFCSRQPVTLAAPELSPVLVYPVPLAPGCLTLPGPGGAPGPGSVERLYRLLGPTRARVLELLDRPMSTSGIAAALHLSPANASRHATVLREAGLVGSVRDGHRVLHRRTRLGEALLNGK